MVLSRVAPKSWMLERKVKNEDSYWKEETNLA